MPAYILHPMFSHRVICLDASPVASGVLSTEAAEIRDMMQLQGQPDLKPISALPKTELAQLLATLRQTGSTLEDSETATLL